MRGQLGKIAEVRKRFTGVFRRYGTKRNFKGAPTKTLLIENIRDVSGSLRLTDHVWMNFTQSFADAGFLKEGDAIEFDARVKPYSKGYVNKQKQIDNSHTDFRLSHPTNVRIVHKAGAT